MANSGPNTNGSQFFITYSRLPKLNKKFTIFGKIIDGFESLDLMEREPVGKDEKPLNEIILHQTKIHANPFAEKEIVWDIF